MLLEQELSEKAIRSFSHRVMRRLYGAGEKGRGLGLEDIQQELRVAWFKASTSYNAELGVPFQAYLATGMKQHINRLIEKNVNRRHTEVLAISLDQPIDSAGGEGKVTIHSTVASEDDLPGTDFERDQHFAYAIRKLKPRAKLFITLLYEQPPELLAEVSKLNRKSEYGRESLGIHSPVSNRLAACNVFDLMGAAQAERASIVRDIRELGQNICEAMAA